MEGSLCVPPERSALIGKAGWKARYIVLGPDPRISDKTTSSKSNRHRTSRPGRHLTRGAPVDIPPPLKTEMHLTIYKQQGDRDFLYTYPIQKIQQCTIEDGSPGRGSDGRQTLKLTVEPEKPTSKGPKTRVGRSIPSDALKSRSKTLTFRDLPMKSTPSVFNWYQTLQTYRSGLDSPESTTSWGLTGEDDGSYISNTDRSSSSRQPQNRNLLSVGGSSSGGYSRRSTRSTPSAASSRPSSNRRNGGQTPDIFLPPDEQQYPARPHILEHIEAVSSAQPVSKPLPPPESILDRAFTMNYIPYTSSLDSDSESDLSNTPGPTRLRSPSPPKKDHPQTSIARLEALMRRASVTRPLNGLPSQILTDPRPPILNPPEPIPSPTQRAIDFISSRPPPAVAVRPTKAPSPSPKKSRRRPDDHSLPSKYPPSSSRAPICLEEQIPADWRRLSIISTASSSGYSQVTTTQPHALSNSKTGASGHGGRSGGSSSHGTRATSSRGGGGREQRRRTTALQDAASKHTMSSSSSLALSGGSGGAYAQHARDESHGSSEMVSLDDAESLTPSGGGGWDLDHSARETTGLGCLSARPVQVPVWGNAGGSAVPGAAF